MPDPFWFEDFLCGACLAVFFVVPFAALLFGVRFDAYEEDEEESLPLSEPRLYPPLRAGHFLCGARLVDLSVSFILAFPFGVCLLAIFCVLGVFWPVSRRTDASGFPSLARSNDNISSLMAVLFVMREVR
jgi:hypothetical protein